MSDCIAVSKINSANGSHSHDRMLTSEIIG